MRVVACLAIACCALASCRRGHDDPPGAAPTVTISAPLGGAAIRLNRPFTVRATVSGGGPKISLAVDGALFGLDPDAPWTFGVPWSSLTAPVVGNHTLQATASWPDGQWAQSAVTTVAVVNGPFATSTADHLVYGADDFDAAGFPRSVAVGDVTGDGVGDLVIGVPFGDGFANGGTDRGDVIVLSGATLGASTDLATATPTASLHGGAANDWFGYAVAVADVNGDGRADVIVGAPQQDGPAGTRTDGGAVYVFYGGTALTGTIDLAGTGTAGCVVYGGTAGDNLGWTVAAGDVNGGGADLVMGAPRLDAPGPPSRTDTGGAYVQFGGTLPASLDLATTAASMVIYGEDAGDEFGEGLAVGEITGDAFADVILGSRRADGSGDTGNDEGEVVVVAGALTPAASTDLSVTTPAAVIYGDDAQDELGTHIAVANVDGLAGNELIVAAFLGDGPTNGLSDAGEVYFIALGASLPTSLDLATGSALTVIYGQRTNDFLGWGLAAGDVDGDGIADLWIGQNGSDGPAGTSTDCGEAVLWLSPGATLPTSVDFSTTAPALVLYGIDANDRAGRAVTLGDVDGDGRLDLVAAADVADGPANVGTDRGEVAVLVR